MLLIGVVLLAAGAGFGFDGAPGNYGIGAFAALVGTLFFIAPALLLNDRRLEKYASFFELVELLKIFRFPD